MSLDIVKLNSLEPPLKVKKDVEKIYDELVQEYEGKYKGVKNRLAGKFSKEKKSEKELEKTKFINSIELHLEEFAKAKAYYSISKQFCKTIDMYCKCLCLMLKKLGVNPPKISSNEHSAGNIINKYINCCETLKELSQLVEKKFWDTAQIKVDPSGTKERFLEMTKFIGIEKIAENAIAIESIIKSIKELADTKKLNESLEALVKKSDKDVKEGAIKTLEDALEYSRTRLNEIVCHLNSRDIEWKVADSQLLSLFKCLKKICAKATDYPYKQGDINAKLNELEKITTKQEAFKEKLRNCYVFDNNMGVDIKKARDDLGELQKTTYGQNIKSESLDCLKILTEKKFDSQYKHLDSEWVKGPYYVLVDSNSQSIKDSRIQGLTGTINESSKSPFAENEVLRFLQVSVLKGTWATEGEYEGKDAVIKYLGVINKEINGAK